MLTVLGRQSFFGEMALLNPSGNAITSVRAKGYAETYHLSSNSYEHLLKQFPTFREYIELVVKLRLAEDLRVNDPTVKVHTIPFLAAFTLPLRCRYAASLPLCPHPLCPPSFTASLTPSCTYVTHLCSVPSIAET